MIHTIYLYCDLMQKILNSFTTSNGVLMHRDPATIVKHVDII